MRTNHINHNTFFHIHDTAMSRVIACSRDSLAQTRTVDLAGAPGDGDLQALGHWLAECMASLATAWAAARDRRHALKQLKRIDRRMLADAGLTRAQLREVVDAMNETRARQAIVTASREAGATWVARDITA